MRVSKFWDFLLIALVAVVFAACNNTVSSTDASKNDGLDFIPGFEPGKTHSKANDVSSSSQDQSSGSDESSSASEESSSSDGEEEESSSSEVEVDFSESEIQVDGSGVAVITDAYLTEVEEDVRSILNSKKDELDNNEEPEGFSESNKVEFAVDDFNFDANNYYCFTESEEWKGITRDKLLETKLPFLWDMDYYDCRDRFSLSFESECVSIYVMAN